MTDEPEPEDDCDEDEKLINRYVLMLMEHFDSVIIFTTRQDPGSVSLDHPRGVTSACYRAGGNFYATLGFVSEFMDMQRQMARNKATQLQCDDSEDGE